MPTIIRYGNGVQTRFEVPGSLGKTVYVNGVATVPASTDFQSVTMTVAPANKAAVQIDYEFAPLPVGTKGELRSTATAAFTLANGITDLILAGSGTVPVTLPSLPYDAQELTVTLETAYTAVSFVANTGQTLKAGVAMLVAAGSFASFRYRAANTTWYRIG